MSLALYRRYRPDTFTEVIGQEHVTEPLLQALRNSRVHHAYLFSGPRGCGKTTSARILARCLNCEQGPTPTPCGTCESCRGLSRGGPGTLDVIEIDAASHGGVDDARELRDRAFFAPAVSRYKIYIIDEAHMVSPAGFNALLKVVEEPPEHVKFVFATTEPEKVIGTIRSRTHHYPFRLVPPARLQDYLSELCAAEGVAVEKPVLPLVVRAGRGSVRDALSVLDQLLAGAGPSGVTYAMAAALLGYTDATLLDDTLESFAAGDGAAVFRVLDRVIEGGHDPRRFAEDLLERLRDLIILDAVPDASPSLFGEVPADQLERMRQQAARFGSAELSRAADLVNTGLTEMRGATAPRLQLELVCARVLLPEAAQDERSLSARLDRMERRLLLGASGPSDAVPAPGFAAAATTTGRPDPAPVEAPPSPQPSAQAPAPAPAPASDDSGLRDARDADAARVTGEAPPDGDAAGGVIAEPNPDQPAATVPVAGLDLAAVRRMWPDVLDGVKSRRRFTWSLLSHNAQVAAVEGRRLTLAMLNAGARDSFLGSGSDEIVRQALIDVLGVDWKVEAIVDPSRSAVPVAPAPAPAPAAAPTAPPAAPTAPAATPTRAPASAPAPAAKAASASKAASGATRTATATPASPAPRVAPAGGSPAAPAAVAPTREDDDEISVDDPDLDGTNLSHLQLLQRDLGAEVIGEYDAE